MSQPLGNEDLRKDVYTLSGSAYALVVQFWAFAEKYPWGSEDLTQCLAGQVVRQLETPMLEIFKPLRDLNQTFEKCGAD